MSYVTLTKTGRALRLTLTPDGREELQARVDAGQSRSTPTRPCTTSLRTTWQTGGTGSGPRRSVP